MTPAKMGAAKTQAIGRLLCDLASPLSKRPIAEITPAEILIIIKKMEKLGQRETARRLRVTIGRVFRLAVATVRAPSDPTYSLKGALVAPVGAPTSLADGEGRSGYSRRFRDVRDESGSPPTPERLWHCSERH